LRSAFLGDGLLFAAALGAGKILLIDAIKGNVGSVTEAGLKPNGLACDTTRKQLLVADVEDFRARRLDPISGRIFASIKLSGRPRWCRYDSNLDLFFVNIRDPPGVIVLEPETMRQKVFLSVSIEGPHGQDIVERTSCAFVARDGRAVVAVDLKTGHEILVVPIPGAPDAIWHNTQRERLYCTITKPGVMVVIDTRAFIIDEEINTEDGANTFAFDIARRGL